MKKVLIITYLPWASPRIPGLARYLPEFGWEPILLTPPLAVKPEAWLKVVETPYRDAFSLRLVRKLFRLSFEEDDVRRGVKERFRGKAASSMLDSALTLGGEIINYPDAKKGWIPFAIEAGSRLLGSGDMAAIISSSSPVASHIIARGLKLRHGIPWVADLRDLWSQNHNYPYSRFRRFFDRRLEQKTLARAEALVTVSRPWADKLSSLHGKAAYTITNGFDPAETSGAVEFSDKFTLTYTGMIYRGKQNPGKLFIALKELLAEGTLDPADVAVSFYGPEERWLDEEISKYGLSAIIKQHGSISRQAALAKQRQSQLLLLFDWDDPQEKGVYPGKVFEYLAARRPVFAIGGVADNVVAELLRQTKGGIHAPAADAVKKALAQLYQEYRLKRRVEYRGDESEISKYSYRETAGRFAEILDKLA